MTNKPVVLCLMGPTGSGKSGFAVSLAHALNAEIVNVDSVLVYQGMDIGSAKPTEAERQQIPHHLVDIRKPHEAYCAEQFVRDGQKAIDAIDRRGKAPLLVGGTMLYFHALQQGLSPLPSADATVRQRLNREREALGQSALYRRLADLDPHSADRISPNDWQRIQRALEIVELSGLTRSQCFERFPPKPAPFTFINVALMPSHRQALYDRINHRFQAMLRRGLVDEVRALLNDNKLTHDSPSLKSVGYRQASQYIEGRLSYELMVQQATKATRRLAKRQLTWLKSWPDLITFDYGSPKAYDAIKAVFQGSV